MEDIGLALADFVSNLENVPSEIRHLFSEITDLDEKYEEAMSRAHSDERSLQKELKDEANREKAGAQEEKLLAQIDKEHLTAKSLCQEKMRLTRKAMGIVQRHLAKLDAEIRQFDKSGNHKQLRTNSASNFGIPTTPSSSLDTTIRIHDGELAFNLPTPKRFSDSIPSLALENALSEADSFYTPTRVPKRRHHQVDSAGGGPGRTLQQQQRQKKQLKLKHPILSLDGVEVDGHGQGGIEESDDRPYCFCRQLSYGDMVGCDGPDCRYEWFHWGCVGLTSSPKGSWYCSECLAKLLEDDE